MKMSFSSLTLAVIISLAGLSSGETKWHYQTFDKPLALYPKKSFGYWPSEESHLVNSGQDAIVKTFKEFRSRGLPVDGICIEPIWQTNYNELKWLPSKFPKPQAMIDTLNAIGVGVGLWENTWLNPDCCNWSEALSKGWLQPADGWHQWMGTKKDQARRLKFEKDEVASWWMDQHKYLFDMNVVFIKHDAQGIHIAPKLADQACAYTGKRIMVHKSWDNWVRPATESCVGTWLQDPTPGNNFTNLRNHVIIAMCVGLRGLWGFSPECPGWMNGGTNEMYQRWIQWGCCAPFPGGYGASKNGLIPWNFGTSGENTYRINMKLRMRLMPFVYSYNWNAYKTKEPLFRALGIDFPDDPTCQFAYYKVTDISKEFYNNNGSDKYSGYENYEFMYGREILVAPVVWEGKTSRDIYLPAGVKWIDYRDGKTVYAGGERIKGYSAPLEALPPMFVKAGSIIPMGPDMQYVDQFQCDPLTLDVYPAETGTGTFTLYEDDGITLLYKTGSYATTAISCKRNGDTVIVDVGASTGDYKGKLTNRTYLHQIHLVDKQPIGVAKDETPLINCTDSTAFAAKAQGWYYNSTKKVVYAKYHSPTTNAVKLVVGKIGSSPVMPEDGATITGQMLPVVRIVDKMIVIESPQPVKKICLITLDGKKIFEENTLKGLTRATIKLKESWSSKTLIVSVETTTGTFKLPLFGTK